MGWLTQIWSRRRRYRELAESMREHVEEKIEEMMEGGLSREEATNRAHREFGNQTLIEEASREVWQWPTVESWWRDVRYAARQLWRSPGFTATVILTLALAIGANSAIFSIANTLLIKSLPYAHPERLGTIYARTTGAQASDIRRAIDGEQWERLRDTVPALESAVYSSRASGANLQAGSNGQYLLATRVSSHYLNILGLRPFIGRNFSEDEDRPHGPRAMILSHRLWNRAFSSNPDIIGQAIHLKGEPYTVIGVLPDNAATLGNADVYTALQPSREGEGQGTNFAVIARLREGAVWQEADAQLNRALADSGHARYFAKTNPGAQRTYYLVPLQKGETGPLRPQVLALMLAAGSILLIACANLAGLSLVRLSRRTSELATRLALGASRWQILRQLWAENLLLALAGGIAGLAVGFAALRGLLLLLPANFLPVADVPLDGRVLGFTLFLSLLTSILFGMLPARAAGKVDLRSSIPGRGVIGAGSIRLRQGLIAGEVALTVVLVAAAGLLVRTLIHLQTMPPGFNAAGVITAKASLDDARYHDPAAFRTLLNESLDAMRKIPGVQNAAVGLTLPFERALLSGVTVGDGKEAGRTVMTNHVYVTPEYFGVLQIPLLAGRMFTDADGPDSQRVIIVNRTFARKYLPGPNPVGRYVDKGTMIVGVAGDTVLSSAGRLNADTAPLTSEETVYFPAAQLVKPASLSMLHAWFQPSWIVRTAAPVEGLTGQMQNALASADPLLPFSGFYSMSDLMGATLATQRVEVGLLAAMSSLALLLSAIGIFALVANLVVQRRREIGIRVALGSTVREAMIHIGKTGMGASTAGVGLGLILCAGALPAMRGVIYGVTVYDAPTILFVLFTLFAISLLATVLPTLRVARIDPARTLREE